MYVTAWGTEYNTILQFYTLLFNNPVIRFNHCSFTTICVHHIITQYRASPEPQSPEPGLSPRISNPPNRPPVTIRVPAPGLGQYCRVLPNRAFPRSTADLTVVRFTGLLPDESVSTEPGSARSIYTIQVSPGGVNHTGFSRMSQVLRNGLCPKQLLNHTRRASPGGVKSHNMDSPGGVKSHHTGFSRRSRSPPNRALPETIVKSHNTAFSGSGCAGENNKKKLLLNHTTRVSPGNIYTRYNNLTQVFHMEA